QDPELRLEFVGRHPIRSEERLDADRTGALRLDLEQAGRLVYGGPHRQARGRPRRDDEEGDQGGAPPVAQHREIPPHVVVGIGDRRRHGLDKRHRATTFEMWTERAIGSMTAARYERASRIVFTIY